MNISNKLILKDEGSPMDNRDARQRRQFNIDSLKNWSGNFESFIDEMGKQLELDRKEMLKLVYDTAASNNDLKEVIAARGGYDSLAERLDQGFVYNGLSESFITDSNPVILDAIETFKSTIDTDKATFKIVNLQDLHYSKRTNMGDAYDKAAPLVMKQLDNIGLLNGAVNAAILNGDNVHGNEARSITKLRNKQVITKARSVLDRTDVFVQIGNHEDNSVFKKATVDRLTEDDLLECYDFTSNRFGEKRYKDISPYCYKDYPEFNLRVISLAGFENPDVYDGEGNVKYPRATASVFDINQINWLVNDALIVPRNYATVIFNHSPLLNFFKNTPYNYMTNVNHDLVEGVINAFATGSKFNGIGTNIDFPAEINADFTVQGKRDLIGIFCGHEHWDADNKIEMVNSIRSVERTCNISVGNNREIGTINQYAFDVIEINTVKRTVNFNRFGQGENLKFNY